MSEATPLQCAHTLQWSVWYLRVTLCLGLNILPVHGCSEEEIPREGKGSLLYRMEEQGRGGQHALCKTASRKHCTKTANSCTKAHHSDSCFTMQNTCTKAHVLQ